MLTDFVQHHFESTAAEGGPDYRRLYRILQGAILGGVLRAGTQLPPSRQLARELRIARNTVIHAYEQLAAEGYVHGGVGSGTFVADTRPDRLVQAEHDPDDAPPEPTARRPVFSRRGAALIAHASASDRQWGAFMAGVPEVRMFPARTWTRLFNRVLRQPDPQLLTYGVGAGHAPLREALAAHLRTARGVRCAPEQLIITSGIHSSLQLIAQMLCDPGDRAWIEDPGYWGASNVLRAAGVEMVPVPVDAQGLQFAHLARPTRAHRQAPPRLVFVSPSHQYPLGAVMSLARRRQLLEYARATGTWVVEDDYDSEFRYGSRPLPALQGLDEARRVLYMGTFSKVLFPGLRMAYLVVPEDLVEGFTRALSEIYRGGQHLTQAVMAAFIAEGHLVSHIRRMRGVYAERRQCLLDAIGRRFGQALPIHDGAAGLHMVLGLPSGCDDRAVSAAAMARGVIARPLSRYYLNARRRQSGLVLGYAHVAPAEIAVHFDTLAEVIEQAR